MLAQSLLLTRDLLLSGKASLQLDDPTGTPWSKGSSAYPVTGSERATKRLQPNIRAVLAEMELFEKIEFAPKTPSKEPRSICLKYDGKTIAEIFAPSEVEFINQLKLVHSFADLRGERVNEVLSQAVPQTASWSAVAGLTPERHKHTWELLGVGLRFAMMVVMRFKHALNCPRPMEYSALVQPMILTPGYTAFPSGHATESYFVAEFLPILAAECGAPGLVLDGDPKADSDFRALAKYPITRDKDLATRQGSLRAQLHRLAYRISENRVVAGLHFPIDSVAGQMLGVTLARYFAARCGLGKGLNLDVGHKFKAAATEVKPTDTNPVEPRLDFGMDNPYDSTRIEPGKVPLDWAIGKQTVLEQVAIWAAEEWST